MSRDVRQAEGGLVRRKGRPRVNPHLQHPGLVKLLVIQLLLPVPDVVGGQDTNIKDIQELQFAQIPDL